MAKPKLKLVSVLEVDFGYEKKRYKRFHNAFDAVKCAIYYDILSKSRKRRGNQAQYHQNYNYTRWLDRLERRVERVMRARYGKILP